MRYNFPFLCFVVISFLFVAGCAKEEKNDEISHLFCDAETIVPTPNGPRFLCDGSFFENTARQTDSVAYSGTHSVLLQKGKAYGMTHRINGVKEGERFIIRVRRLSKTGKGILYLSSKPGYTFYHATSTPVENKTDKGWELLELDLKIPYGIDTVAIFMENTTEEPVYFDDLEIMRLEKKNPVYPDKPSLQLFIDSLDLARMIQLREEALKIGILDEDAKQEFTCSIVYNESHYSGTIRFKGDWTDHLKTSKWSFRIALDGGRTIMGKRTFSIQHPETRGYAYEWFIHKLLKKEGVLTTMYEFIPVELNGNMLGLYAMEEHFAKQLLESQNRREGVIIKFNEELFWQKQLLAKQEKSWGYFPEFGVSVMDPFGAKKTLGSPVLKQGFILGQNLGEMYRTYNPNVDQYLDVETYTKYLAVLTLVNGTGHTTQWHNQRWYVNPVSAKLEPIAYDFSSSFEFNPVGNKTFSLLETMTPDKPVAVEHYIKGFVFKNPQIQERYLAHIERMINDDYLNSVFEEMGEEIKAVDQLLAVEYPRHKVEKQVLRDNVIQIKEHLPKFKKWLTNVAEVKPDTTNKRLTINKEISVRLPITVYKQGSKTYAIHNNSGQNIQVYAYKSKQTKKKVKLPNPVEVGVTNWLRDRVDLKLDEKASAIYYTMDETDFKNKASIHSWPAPIPSSPRQTFIKSTTN
ncbi:CotH kinase family protein, partial [Bacteroidota bacterium]